MVVAELPLQTSALHCDVRADRALKHLLRNGLLSCPIVTATGRLTGAVTLFQLVCQDLCRCVAADQKPLCNGRTRVLLNLR